MPASEWGDHFQDVRFLANECTRRLEAVSFCCSAYTDTVIGTYKVTQKLAVKSSQKPTLKPLKRSTEKAATNTQVNPNAFQHQEGFQGYSTALARRYFGLCILLSRDGRYLGNKELKYTDATTDPTVH